MNTMTYQIVLMVLLFAIMYFLLIRPQKKKEKEINGMRNNIQVGDDIITIGGIFGKVVKVKEDRLTIQVGADKTKFEITRWAVSKVENQGSKSKVKLTEETEEAESKRPTPKKMKKLGSDSTEPAVDTASNAAEEATKSVEE